MTTKFDYAILGTSFRVDFNIIRFFDNKFISNKVTYNAILEIDDDSDDPESSLCVQAMASIKNWFDMCVDGCVAICVQNKALFKTLLDCDNHIMLTPEEPFDHILILLLTAKINAIGNNIVTVAQAGITTNTDDGFGNRFKGNPLEMLPTNTQWVGTRAFYDKPWWSRSDGSMLDIWANDTDNLLKKPDILIDIIGQNTLTSNSDVSKNTTEPAKIIKPNFKLIKKD